MHPQARAAVTPGPAPARHPTALEAEFLYDLQATGYPDSTIRSYRSALAVAWQITRVDPERFAHEQAAALLRQDAAPATRRKWLAAVRTFHDWLMRHGYPYNDAARLAELPRPQRPEPRPLLPDQITALRRAARLCNDLEWRAFFWILDATGVRATEPLALTLGDAQQLLARARDRMLVLRFNRTKVGGWTFPLHELVDGRPAARTLVAVIRKYVDEARPRAFTDPGSPLFVHADGRHRAREWLDSRWREFCALAGVVHALPGQLRHTFACEELERTRDLLIVRRWMNHASITTTEFYARYVGLI